MYDWNEEHCRYVVLELWETTALWRKEKYKENCQLVQVFKLNPHE